MDGVTKDQAFPRQASDAQIDLCRTCGSVIKNSARFCGSCGTGIEDSEAGQQDATSNTVWHYERNGEQHGPVSERDLSQLIACGTLNQKSLVWCEGYSEWRPLATTPLASYVQGHPPLTGQAVSNGIIWVLAFAPLIGLFLEELVWGLTDFGFESLWWITLALNVGLSSYDERNLQKSGHDTSEMGGAWLVPVYLFKRAKILEQNNAYFIVWCVTFGVVLLGE